MYLNMLLLAVSEACDVISIADSYRL